MTVVPKPDPGDVGYNDPITRRLNPGEMLIVTFEPTQRVTDFALPFLAMSKHPESSYEVWMDGSRQYGPAPIPPTDIDDMVPTFIPAKRFSESMTVYVRNLSDTTARTYSVQPIGWEASNGT
ncbi:hypothetical protein [Haloarcula pellucida]|uniref:Uncharacterized protein n=1 Tax=Haloarcula pellucida TaxID=1427151 RepID=A0A830GNN8_9EURY|nr:hypothetical protein [Halomicroarcula pellucida]MBX0348239.1 hypothetical protein [Halomicroarcula pellucida]GGN97637.1 hypothetical protein GCM10009030_27090 [Halomicroarcula pellucida]